MTEVFRDSFVGEKGSEVLKKLMKNGNEILIELAKTFQERQDAELLYIRALRKHSDNLNRLASKSKGSLGQALDIIAKQTEKESDAHSNVANTLLQQVAIPLKNLAEEQNKERKTVEEALNGKMKNWKDKREKDNKYRTRHFEKSKEIETLYIKMSESTKANKISSRDTGKERTLSTPLVMSCIMPNGRYANASEKPSVTPDAKYQANLDNLVQKAEEDLEKIDQHYHQATKDVELARQMWDAEFGRTCTQMEQMEIDRINEIKKSIESYATSMQIYSDSVYQISQDLSSIHVNTGDDIVAEAKTNVQTTEIEILLYDISAEDERNPMSEQRRILSLMRWKEFLEKDLNDQRQYKGTKSSSSSLSKSFKEDLQIDDEDEDGAMCSSTSHSQKDAVVNRDGSSSSSNDDDGAMRHHRREKKNRETVKPAATFLNTRQSSDLFEWLYRASLYKIERVYNRFKSIPEPYFAQTQRLTKNFNDKGWPQTLLRIPTQELNQTPASAPCGATQAFAKAMPIFAPRNFQAVPMSYTAPPNAPMMMMSRAFDQMPPLPPPQDNHLLQSAPTYPVLASAMTRAAEPMPQHPQAKQKFVTAVHPYRAQHRDELTLKPGDVIAVIERRDDGWCKGNINGTIGLFPANYTKEC